MGRQVQVSICMITYNHASFIAQAIESILMQKTSFDFELIIGEDCSIDNTLGICQEYVRRYPDIITLITSDHNVGMHANGDRVINKCRGKYMAFCEGDDYWIDPYKLQKQIDFLETNADYGLVFTRHKILNNRSFRNSELLKVVGFQKLILANLIGTLTVCLRKELYNQYREKICPEQQGWLSGDYAAWLWFSLYSKIKYLPEITAMYRLLDESASHTKDHVKKLRLLYSSYSIRRFFLIQSNAGETLSERVDEGYYKFVYNEAFWAKDMILIQNMLKFYQERREYTKVFWIKCKYISIQSFFALNIVMFCEKMINGHYLKKMINRITS